MASEKSIHRTAGTIPLFQPGSSRIGAAPTTVRETVGDSATYFGHVSGERELGHDDCVIRNIVELSLEVDAREIVIEAHAAKKCATAEEHQDAVLYLVDTAGHAGAVKR